MFIFIICAVFVGISAQSNQEKTNKFFDQLIEGIKRSPELELDPYPLEDKVVGFEKKIFLIKWKGEAKLHQAIISGLTSIHRTGDCTMTIEKGVTNIRAKLGMGVLNAKTTAKIHFMNVGPSVTIKARIGFAEVDAGLSVNILTDQRAKLTNFRLREIKGLDVTVEGLGPLNIVLNIITGLATNFFRLSVKKIAENIMAGLAREQLSKMPIPMLS